MVSATHCKAVLQTDDYHNTHSQSTAPPREHLGTRINGSLYPQQKSSFQVAEYSACFFEKKYYFPNTPSLVLLKSRSVHRFCFRLRYQSKKKNLQNLSARAFSCVLVSRILLIALSRQERCVCCTETFAQFHRLLRKPKLSVFFFSTQSQKEILVQNAHSSVSVTHTHRVCILLISSRQLKEATLVSSHQSGW